MVAALFTACKKDKDDAPAKTHKVVLKVTASNGVNLSDVAYGFDNEITTATNLTGATWTSPELTQPNGARSIGISIGGAGPNASATMKVQVVVDGEVKKEGTATGQILHTSVIHFF